MSNSKSGNHGGAANSLDHVALFPSSGVGHLMPFLRLASTLVRRRCRVTLITTHPIVSLAETRLLSRFLAAFPQVTEKHFTLLPLDAETAKGKDPFFLQWDAISRSAHLLSPLLSSLSPPPHVLISDVTLISSTIPVTRELEIQNFVLCSTCATMFTVLSNFSAISDAITSESFRLNGAIDMPRSTLPPWLLDPENLFTKLFKQSSLSIGKADGVLINSFEALEKEALRCQPPSVFAVGPFPPEEFEKEASEGAVGAMEWLEIQPEGSVVYVSFGSRAALGKGQIKELANGLVMSGSKFFWVMKTTVIDKEEEGSIEEILGIELLEKIKNADNGFVFKGWVNQGDVLGHKAVGGFLSHCGWNSVTEAAWYGVPVVAWPLHGDQKIIAEVVEAGGWGRIVKGWCWDKGMVVEAEDIRQTVNEVMGSERIKLAAAAVGEAAKKAVGVGGSSEAKWMEIFGKWNKRI